jgi:hypothetical protein
VNMHARASTMRKLQALGDSPEPLIVSNQAMLKLVDRAFKIAVNMETNQAMLSKLSTELRKLDSTFDFRNFGFHSFRKFCESPAMSSVYKVTVSPINSSTLYISELERREQISMPKKKNADEYDLRTTGGNCDHHICRHNQNSYPSGHSPAMCWHYKRERNAG